MIFSDLIFVFAFLPIYVIASFSCHESWTKNLVGVAASVIFIAWGRPWYQWYYVLILLPVFLIYISGLLSRRINRIAAETIGDTVAVGYAVFGVIAAGSEPSLRSALISVGLLLFALRSISYMKKVCAGMKPEKNPFCLAVYLISFENMLIAQLADYEEVREKLYSRRPTLSKMSAGLTAFISGFAKTAVLGMAFDRVRVAATEYEAFPWANALILIAVTFCEVYVITAGISEMSCGLGLMNGFSPKGQTPAFLPACRLEDHVSEMWESLPGFVRFCFCQRSGAGLAISLAGVSLISGIFLGMRAGAGAFFGVIVLAIILEGMAPKRSKAVDIAFSLILSAAAFLVLTVNSVGGVGRFFAAFDMSAYEYDITFVLHKELMRNMPWLIIGVIVVSPLYRLASAAIREKMSESERFYAAARITGTVVSGVLLVLATIAAAS